MQRLQRKLLFMFISFTLLPNVYAVSLNCHDIWKQVYAIERDPRFDNVITRKRQRSLKQTKIKNLIVKSASYKVLALIGEGTSSVYLALSPQGHRVIIKHVKESEGIDLEWINSIYYEVAVTQYYLSRGVTVPKIVDYEIVSRDGKIQEGFLVKEYHEGLTRDEFLEARGLNFLFGVKYQKIEEAYEKSEKQMAEIHPGFKKWLRENKIDLYRYRFASLTGLINFGDFSGMGHNNWLFDINSYQWILFDP